jgi:hypothetical protein
VGIGASTLAPGRFVQAKLILRGDGKATPSGRRIRVAYGRVNLPPFISEVTLLPKNIALVALPQEGARERTAAVNDKGLLDLKRVPGEPMNPIPEPVKARQQIVEGVLTVAWAAVDANGDELQYDLFYRAESDNEWRAMKSSLDLPFYTFSALSLPDGHYQFRVVAKDDLSNAPGQAKRETRESLWFTIDNSPPRISKLEVQRKKTLSFTAQDAQSVIVRAEYAVDGSPLRPLTSKDGLVDSREEQFEVSLPELPGNTPHVVTVRLQDEAGNIASGEARF